MKRQAKKEDKEKIRREQQLVARCVRGDKKAWDEFVDTYKSLIYSAIIRTFHFVGHKNTEEAAGDIFQDVFASLLRDNCAKLRSFKWKYGCSLASWMHIIAKNLAFDYIRKFFSQEKIIASLTKGSEDEKSIFDGKKSLDETFLKKLEHEEKVNLFEKALKELPKEDIYLIELLYFREYSHKRIAKILNKTVDALYMQKKRVTEKLKKIVEEYIKGGI